MRARSARDRRGSTVTAVTSSPAISRQAGDVEIALRREVVIEEALRDLRLAREVVDRDVVVGAIGERGAREREELRAALIVVESDAALRLGRGRPPSARGRRRDGRYGGAARVHHSGIVPRFAELLTYGQYGVRLWS